MRLGQLSRKLDKKPAEIREILKSDFQVEIENDLNARIEDIHATAILEKFGLSNLPLKSDEIQEPIVNTVEEEKEEIIANSVEERDIVNSTEETTVPLENNESDKFVPLPVDPNAELIKAPKIKLEGLKVVGKIELKEIVKETNEELAETAEGNDELKSGRRAKKTKELSTDEDDDINSIYKDKKGIYHFSQTQRENRIKSLERIKLEQQELRKKENKIKHYQAISSLSDSKVEKQKTKARQNKLEASKKKETKPERKGVWGKFLNWLND